MANNSMIAGDQPIMPFTCYDSPGVPHDWTGATLLEAHFPLAGGGTLVVSGGAVTPSNQTSNKGQVMVDFIGTDTTGIKIGDNLQVLIKGVQSGRPVQFKGVALDVDSSDVG